MIPDKEVRELLGVVPEDSLNELVAAIAEGSADRAFGLVHTFQKEGRNLQHFCREAIRHMRNLLIARVCGADSDLIAATADQRPALTPSGRAIHRRRPNAVLSDSFCRRMVICGTSPIHGYILRWGSYD